MALVAYDNSDSSEYEDENETAPVVTLNQKNEPTRSNAIPEITPSQVPSSSLSTEENPTLFNLLPQPCTKRPAVIEEDDEFLHKKETAKDVVKPKAKITVPSLSDFKDVEDKPLAKPRAANGKKSGLLSMLPQPRNAGITRSATSLVPNVLTKKPLVPTSVKKKAPLPSPVKKTKTDAKSMLNSYSDESDNDDAETNDFFSINKAVELPSDDVPLDIDLPVQPPKATAEKKASNLESFFKKDVPQHVELQPDYSGNSEVTYNTDEGTAPYSTEASSSYSNGYIPFENSSSNDVALDDEAIRQLCGARGKRKREDIQIVDVNQQDVLADARELLLRGLMDDTTKRVSVKKTGHEPTSQQKRKHQITYLAHQAKANEAELQNQWANNRMSKRKTQSKYGF